MTLLADGGTVLPHCLHAVVVKRLVRFPVSRSVSPTQLVIFSHCYQNYNTSTESPLFAGIEAAFRDRLVHNPDNPKIGE